MSNMYLKKYPVVSEDENEYLVTISDSVMFGFIRSAVFVREKGWFGHCKFREVSGGVYEAVEFDYDYVKIAKQAVKKYENRVKRELERERLKAQGIAKFDKWDGVIDD